MSEKKKQVIHVKDLIIKADHVTLDQPEPKHDPFFGPRKPRQYFQQEERAQMKETREQDKDEDHSEDQQKRRLDPLFGFPRRSRETAEPRKQREFDPILGRPLKVNEESTEGEKENKDHEKHEES